MNNLSEWRQAMSQEYWERWNDEVQAKIDRDIEANRKAEGAFRINAPKGAEVKVEQTASSFVFGAHIFNFNQLGSDERNAKYRDLFGTLFNSATIAFYWKTMEFEEGKPRFVTEYRDTPEFWNHCPNPKEQPHWRRPSIDAVVEFCLSKGIRLHGHTLTWGSNTWQYPDWLMNKVPFDALRLANLERNPKNGRLPGSALYPCFGEMSAEEFADRYPAFTTALNTAVARHIIEIALRYGDKVDSWDVVNESAGDYGKGAMVPGSRICKSGYGPMPGDYTYRAFKIAESILPDRAKLNINDYNMTDAYLHQVQELLARGCKIDIMGAQMHLFDPQSCLDIADGKTDREFPEAIYEKFTRLAKANLPIHLSEITITAPHNDTRGQAIQAVIAHNLYRLWFSLKPMMGITWWNVVDDCGAPGEPSVSGLFSRAMAPKPAYYALENLINHEWRTNTCVKADAEGCISFRGFRGTYRLTWLDEDNHERTQKILLQ